MNKDFKKDHLIGSFLDYLFIEKGLSQNTVLSYKNDIHSFSLWSLKELGIPLKKINKIDINQFISHLFKEGLKSSSVNRKISTLKAFYTFLLKKKEIEASPMEDIVMAKQEKYLPVSMSEIEVEKLLNSPDVNISIERRDKAMIEMLYATGMRLSLIHI